MLNGGELSSYTAIGEDGIPVWTNAHAFRNALARSPRLGQEYADFLAEPRFNSSNTHVDWYIPFEHQGSGEHEIVSWSAASKEEKRKALAELLAFSDKLEDFGLDMQARAINSDDRLFSHFLTGTSEQEQLPAIHFPDESCIYIVDGKPVITFWGFLNKGARLSGKPFAALMPPPDPETRKAGAAAAGTAAATGGAKRSHLWCWLLPLLLLLLLLLGYLLWKYLWAPKDFSLDLGLGQTPAAEQSVAPSADDKEKPEDNSDLTQKEEPLEPVKDDDLKVERVPYDQDLLRLDGIRAGTPLDLNGDGVADGVAVDTDGDGVLDGIDTNGDGAVDAVDADGNGVVDGIDADGDGAVDTAADGQDAAAAQAPEDLARTDAAAADADNAQDVNAADAANAQDTAQNASSAGNADSSADSAAGRTDNQASEKPLELSKDDIQNANVKALDGKWESRSGIFDSKTGEPVNISYDFKDGKGTATITRKDGTKCTAPVNGGFSGGALTIDGNSKADCGDGKTYNLPKVTCKPSKDGKTRCTGNYAGSSSVNMDLYR